MRDLRTNKTTLVSRATGTRGAEANRRDNSGSSIPPSRPMAGASRSNPTRPTWPRSDRNHATDVFVRDLRAHTTTLVSRASGDGRGDGQRRLRLRLASPPTARSVAFDSTARNLDSGIPPLDRTRGMPSCTYETSAR